MIDLCITLTGTLAVALGVIVTRMGDFRPAMYLWLREWAEDNRAAAQLRAERRQIRAARANAKDPGSTTTQAQRYAVGAKEST